MSWKQVHTHTTLPCQTTSGMQRNALQPDTVAYCPQTGTLTGSGAEPELPNSTGLSQWEPPVCVSLTLDKFCVDCWEYDGICEQNRFWWNGVDGSRVGRNRFWRNGGWVGSQAGVVRGDEAADSWRTDQISCRQTAEGRSKANSRAHLRTDSASASAQVRTRTRLEPPLEAAP